MKFPTPISLLVVPFLLAGASGAQVIEFESGGLKYQTITKRGVTVMFAHLPTTIREYSVLQVAISNGSRTPQTVRPEDFVFRPKPAAASIRASAARAVVYELMEKARRNDVIKLVSTYELGIYGMERFRSTNGYEVRRRAALAELTSNRLQAAAAASAIALVPTKLAPGESTDGAVFFSSLGKPLGPGKLVFVAAGETFEFETEAAPVQ